MVLTERRNWLKVYYIVVGVFGCAAGTDIYILNL